MEYNQKVECVLPRIGLINGKKSCDTLQGSIWRAQCSENPQKKVVIKVTRKSLHKQSKCIVDGQMYDVHENIVREQNILRYLNQIGTAPKSMIEFKQFVKSNSLYFLVMSDGGESLFEFVRDSHMLITEGVVCIKDWHKVCNIILQQMIECIQFMHENNVCHHDISLENFVIGNVEIEVNTENDHKTKGQIKFVEESIQIKICDFGLAHKYTDPQCLSSKCCGKRQYKSPEAISRKSKFSAKKNDIWAIGVCLFMMMVGTAPFSVAHKSDELFASLMIGQMNVIKLHNREHYIDPHLMTLLQGIFKYEQERFSLDDLIKK